MRQLADGDLCHALERVGAKSEHLIEPACRDVGKAAIRIAHDIHMVGNRTGIEHFENLERRLRAKHHHLADILQSQPDLIPFRRRSNVRAER